MGACLILEMSVEEATANLRSIIGLHEEQLKEREAILQEISRFKSDLQEAEKLGEKQNWRLEKLKFLIDNERIQKEQLEVTMSQHARPPNIREKIFNIIDRMANYKQEEESLIDVYCTTLETVRKLNASIICKSDSLQEIDMKIASLRKEVAYLKQGLKKLKLEN